MVLTMIQLLTTNSFHQLVKWTRFVNIVMPGSLRVKDLVFAVTMGRFTTLGTSTSRTLKAYSWRNSNL
jgi:hypothetical protein